MKQLLDKDENGVYIVPPYYLKQVRADYLHNNGVFEAIYIDCCHYPTYPPIFYGFYELNGMIYYRKLSLNVTNWFSWDSTKPDYWYASDGVCIIDKEDFEKQLEIADIMDVI